ncbi:MAG: hypothetical protein WC812_01715 [Candidatus Pacearchaeota archaeon]|jgi:hypothetical protein
MKEFKKFKGEFKRHAHQIIEDMKKEGYYPQSIKDLMQNRMECTQEGYPQIIYSASDTKDAIAYNSKGDAKIILDSEKITSMNYQTKFKHPNTSLPITNNEWEELSGKNVLFIQKDQISSLENSAYYSKEEILDSREWNFLARDSKTLSNYFDYILPLIEKSGFYKFKLETSGIFLFGGFGYGRSNSLDVLNLGAPMHRSSISEKDLFNGTNTFIGVKES